MKNANSLNREEMRKVTGGLVEPPVCNPDGICPIFIHGHLTYGICKMEAVCVCSTTDSNMVTWYGDTSACSSVS